MKWIRRVGTWLMILLRFVGRVVAAFLRNRGVLLAGGVGYNALLSLVPFLILTVALLSQFFDNEHILGILRTELTVLAPQQTETILQAAETFLENRAATSAVSFAILIFFSSIAFRMLEEAMAAIFHTPPAIPRRRFWVSALLPYTFILPLMIALFFMTMLTSSLDALGDRTLHLFDRTISVAGSVNLLLRLSGLLGMVLLFTAVYRILPVARISTRRALIGGLCAALLTRLVSAFMAYYFSNISMVNLLYGSLATVIVMLLSLEIAFVILLFGAQVIAELEASAAAGVPWYQKP